MADPVTTAQIPGVASRLLTPGEALLLLILLVGLLFLLFSTVLAAWTLWFRSRKLAEERALQDRGGRWRHEIQEILYGDGDADRLQASIGDAEHTEFLNFLLEYARRLEGEERDQIARLARPHLPRILDYLDHPVEGRRMRTVQTLGELGLPHYGPKVIAALDDPSPDVAMVAAVTLARAENAAFAGEVLERLDRFSHWRRDFLAAILASMGLEAAPHLRGTLADPAAPDQVRAVAADALALIDDPAAADVAHDVVVSDPGVELGAAALRLLAGVGRAEHVEAVRRAVEAPELPVRLAAVRALGHIGSADDAPPLEAIARGDPSPWVAIAAARALKESGSMEPLELLAGSKHPRAALGLQVTSEVRSW